jgi:hypothetical protein
MFPKRYLGIIPLYSVVKKKKREREREKEKRARKENKEIIKGTNVPT